MKQTAFKRIVLATALAVAAVISCVAERAQAFTFGEGDLVLAIYGNNTEALIDLGNESAILAPGGPGISNLNVSAALAAAGVGTNPVRYTVFGHDSNLATVYAGTTFSPGSINPNQVQLTFQFESSIGMQGLGGFTGDTIAKADPKSFSSNLNQSGVGNFAGSWPVAMQGSLGQVLNILQGDVNTNGFTQVGRVLLTADGFLTVGNPGPAAVPLPAGVVLFGTGLIGLAGIARRSFKGMAA